MNLTRYTDYSLRVLMYLTIHSDELSNISEIAKSFNISRNHLVKVVHHLAQLGYINTTRGRGGGIELAFSAKDISVGEVIRATEETEAIVDCWEPTCPFLPACNLKFALNEATNAFLEVMDKYTIDDLVKNKKQLLKLIS